MLFVSLTNKPDILNRQFHSNIWHRPDGLLSANYILKSPITSPISEYMNQVRQSIAKVACVHDKPAPVA